MGLDKYAIVDYVNKEKPSMLVLASRALGAVTRFMLGSVSDYCAHNCEVPVLIVKETNQ